jgi:hypothetical protein
MIEFWPALITLPIIGGGLYLVLKKKKPPVLTNPGISPGAPLPKVDFSDTAFGISKRNQQRTYEPSFTPEPSDYEEDRMFLNSILGEQNNNEREESPKTDQFTEMATYVFEDQ